MMLKHSYLGVVCHPAPNGPFARTDPAPNLSNPISVDHLFIDPKLELEPLRKGSNTVVSGEITHRFKVKWRKRES